MKKYFFLLCLLFVSTLSFAQIRIKQVDPTSNTITFQNFGASTVDISHWWVCARFVYTCLDVLTVESGSFVLTAGSELVVSGFNLNNVSSDLALYTTSSFSSATAMEDFVQWGAGGIGRESVAVAKGIWDANTFIAGTVSPPYFYNGNGSSDNGVTFWESSLSISENDFSKSISVAPNPSNGFFIIESDRILLTEFRIYNLLGKLVYKEQLPKELEKTLNLQLKTGLYLIKLHAGERIALKRLVIH